MSMSHIKLLVNLGIQILSEFPCSFSSSIYKDTSIWFYIF
uniref:Uncharacterized protein n=1 Tax=Rhizophora mucronata TaxID=61149 RepID=A0A2P2QUX5_RHIMU